jgi:histidine triad (HIT) family protein
MDCLFCKIAAGEIPAQKLYEDDDAVVFADIHPQAPVHVLLIPRKHIASLAHLSPGDERLLGHLHAVAKKIAEERGLSKGFRTVMNTGEEGGQTVDHLHLHLLGGRTMHWPPGLGRAVPAEATAARDRIFCTGVYCRMMCGLDLVTARRANFNADQSLSTAHTL